MYGIISAYSNATTNNQNTDESINSTITIASATDAENHDVFGDLFRSTSIIETEIEANNATKVRQKKIISSSCLFVTNHMHTYIHSLIFINVHLLNTY